MSSFFRQQDPLLSSAILVLSLEDGRPREVGNIHIGLDPSSTDRKEVQLSRKELEHADPAVALHSPLALIHAFRAFGGALPRLPSHVTSTSCNACRSRLTASMTRPGMEPMQVRLRPIARAMFSPRDVLPTPVGQAHQVGCPKGPRHRSQPASCSRPPECATDTPGWKR